MSSSSPAGEPYVAWLGCDAVGTAFRPGDLELTDRAVALAALERGQAVLDVACGTGATVAHLRRRHSLRAFGLDRSRTVLKEGVEPGGAPLVEAEGDRLPFAAGRFDALFCECALGLLGGPSRTLWEFRRVLRPGGALVVSDVYLREPESVPAATRAERFAGSCLQGASGREELLAAAEAAGFATLHWEDHSRQLVRFAARLLLAGAPVDGIWAPLCGGGRGVPAPGRPGYYLLVARREG